MYLAGSVPSLCSGTEKSISGCNGWGTTTPSKVAAQFGYYLEIVKLLLRCPKDDISIRDESDFDALKAAKWANQTDIVSVIESQPKLLKLGFT